MKKVPFVLFILAIVSCSFQTVAQSTPADTVAAKIGEMINKVFNTEVYMDVDTILFNTKQANFYLNEESKAMIMTMVAPQSFQKAEEHFNKESNKDGYKVVEKKKLTHNGKNILYQSGILKRDGKKAHMYMYAIECGPQSIIFFTGMHMAGDEKKFFPAIERAALSASLTK
ncbi:MAG TPA: hypothetical protein VEB86_17975 [Chryseosolibacter sp.]|nr:hypothetical protein [Chryseosolibacter sp.]